MFVASVITAIAIQAAAVGWQERDSTSAVDGQRSYLAGVQSQEVLRNSIGQPDKALLVVSCVNNQRSVSLIWPTFLGRDEVYVTWRTTGEPVRYRFGVLPGGTNASAYGRDAERLLSAIEGGGTMALRVNAYQDAQEATFDLAGGAPVVAKTREACPGS